MTADETSTRPWAVVTGIAHVRLTVREIGRSKQFYRQLLGSEPVIDASGQVDEPGVTEDAERFYGGCVFAVGDQLLGLRPVAAADDRFDSTRVGLDHVSLVVETMEELRAAERRLTEAGVPHGEVQELPEAGMAILSLQDPDDINVELAAATR